MMKTGVIAGRVHAANGGQVVATMGTLANCLPQSNRALSDAAAVRAPTLVERLSDRLSK